MEREGDDEDVLLKKGREKRGVASATKTNLKVENRQKIYILTTTHQGSLYVLLSIRRRPRINEKEGYFTFCQNVVARLLLSGGQFQPFHHIIQKSRGAGIQLPARGHNKW